MDFPQLFKFLEQKNQIFLTKPVKLPKTFAKSKGPKGFGRLQARTRFWKSRANGRYQQKTQENAHTHRGNEKLTKNAYTTRDNDFQCGLVNLEIAVNRNGGGLVNSNFHMLERYAGNVFPVSFRPEEPLLSILQPLNF